MQSIRSLQPKAYSHIIAIKVTYMIPVTLSLYYVFALPYMKYKAQ